MLGCATSHGVRNKPREATVCTAIANGAQASGNRHGCFLLSAAHVLGQLSSCFLQKVTYPTLTHSTTSKPCCLHTAFNQKCSTMPPYHELRPTSRGLAAWLCGLLTIRQKQPPTETCTCLTAETILCRHLPAFSHAPVGCGHTDSNLHNQARLSLRQGQQPADHIPVTQVGQHNWAIAKAELLRELRLY